MEQTAEIKLTQNSLKVLERRYLKKDENGQVIETPKDMFRRVAKAIAQADLSHGKSYAETQELEDEFYNMMVSLDFLPNSPTLMNAGRRLGQLSACFVLPIDDSMESIFEAVKNSALIHKSGGGTGFSFSRLRPNGDIVGSTKGVSSGPVSFMTVFDTATEAVKQGGTRRGANMAILRIDHPDIIEFIRCKENTEKLNNFNISVALTDSFMSAVEQDEDYELVNPRDKLVVKKLNARYVFDLIVNHAWQNGEPGVVFIDRINEKSPTPDAGLIESTNPCGEQPLLPYESCNLGSINLAQMVNSQTKDVDWEKLRSVTWRAVHFLDNVVDVNKYPVDIIGQTTRLYRKIGLGVMGWADMLIQLSIPYNSEEALQFGQKLMGFIQSESYNASEGLAEIRGVFPRHSESIFAGARKMRNATVTTIAPTGTLSIIAGCSSGIEPLFAVSYVRNIMDGTKMVEVNPHFEKIAREGNFYSDKLMERISERSSLCDFNEIPEDVRQIFVTAHDITPQYHIKMQAAFQKHVDNAVSKTVNFNQNATADDIKNSYILAYTNGCKGVTVYRDGSRQEQVLSVNKCDKKKTQPSKYEKIAPRTRPQITKGMTQCMLTGCGNLYVTINEDERAMPFEVFNQMGKAGGCAASQSEAIGRLVSLALRCNIANEELINQLKGISCHQPIWTNGGRISSCADAVAKAMENFCRKNTNVAIEVNDVNMIMGACPDCGGTVAHEGGCSVCHDCGYTKCS